MNFARGWARTYRKFWNSTCSGVTRWREEREEGSQGQAASGWEMGAKLTLEAELIHFTVEFGTSPPRVPRMFWREGG